MTAPVVVFAVGNPSRGDDALGPLLAARFAAEIEAAGRQDFEVVEDFQLQVEHALDLEDRALALFIDAGIGTPPPFCFRRIFPARSYGHTTHALAPEAVLQVFEQTLGAQPPPAFVFCVRGESFELGDSLSPEASERLEAALEYLRKLAAEPALDAWESLIGNR